MSDFTGIHFGKAGCPICGRPDYDYYTEEKAKKAGYCNRVCLFCFRAGDASKFGDGGATLNATTGGITVHSPFFEETEFVCVGQTKNGFYKFVNLEYYELMKKWEEKGYTPKAKSDGMEGLHKTMVQQAAKAAGDKPVVKTGAPLANPYPLATVVRRDQVYRAFLKILTLEDCTKELLCGKDKWSVGLFERATKEYLIKTLPPADYVRFHGDKKDEFFKLYKYAPSRKKIMERLIEEVGEPVGVPGFYKKDGKWTFGGFDGYVIPVFDNKMRIMQLRIRVSDTTLMDNAKRDFEKAVESGEFVKADWSDPEVKGRFKKKQSKYLYFSSANKEGGVSAGALCSVYGLRFLDNYKKGEETVAYICEGEKKAIVITEMREILSVSLPGVGMYEKFFEPLYVDDSGNPCSLADILRKAGVETMAVANDADMATNPQVKKATAGLMKRLLEYGFKVQYVFWDEAAGKGIDDCLLSGGRLHWKNMKP